MTNPDSENYVTPTDRIAVFDNGGTLWGEQPLYFQAIFAFDRLKEMAKVDPSILTSDVLKAAVAGDMEAVSAAGAEGLLEINDITHAGLSVDEFTANVQRWMATARHPETGLFYSQMTYQPMVELLSYLRDEGFATYIVSGGGIHFIRAFAERCLWYPSPTGDW